MRGEREKSRREKLHCSRKAEIEREICTVQYKPEYIQKKKKEERERTQSKTFYFLYATLRFPP